MTQQPSSSPDGSYRVDAVPLGPFDAEPFDLQRLACLRPDGSWRRGADIRAFLGVWLGDALTAAGVTLGDYDRVAVGLIAEDGWTTVQVVAGWIARAGRGADRTDADRRLSALPGRDPPIDSRNPVDHA